VFLEQLLVLAEDQRLQHALLVAVEQVSIADNAEHAIEPLANIPRRDLLDVARELDREQVRFAVPPVAFIDAFDRVHLPRLPHV